MSVTHARHVGKSLAATLVACLAVVCTATVVIDAMTDRLEHWTFEDVRRYKAQRARLAATSLEVRTATNTRRTLWASGSNVHRVMLVDFIYTTCPTVCQALGADFTRLQGEVTALDSRVASSIELVSLSFDGEKDTPA